MSLYHHNAHLYDIAFSWDTNDEVNWLISRLGSGVKRILEPACGSGRMFPTFAKHNIEVVGVELSATMISRANSRMSLHGLSQPNILCGDMANFDLGFNLDGAICPINSFSYLLAPSLAESHLKSVAKHLTSGARYFVQLDMVNFNTSSDHSGDCTWTMEKDNVKVRTTWHGESFDPATRLDTQVCRFEVLSGPDEGLVLEDEQVLRLWSWPEWTELLNESPFTLASCYDGNTSAREPLPSNRVLLGLPLVWHELILP